MYRYSISGGTVLARLAPPKGSFNNVSGVTTDADRSLFVSELGEKKIYKFNPDGQVMREYQMACQPYYMAISGDWVEVSCDGKIVSLNKGTGEIRQAENENGSPPSRATGLTYGPDSLLYVLDGASVVAYRVQR